ncbi:hypothetical protein [Streptomyces catenulae]|uniref:Uncharacterized protein n=1 Tax=Streptomyces catenulae TaxID=66875 RepID=A0ABV2YTE2_9ACTN|nr:hypothetical protein [Streptomyces catenulae]
MLVSVRVCDVCKRVGVEARRYTVTEEERTACTDRCADHAGVLEGILEAEKPQVEDGNHADRGVSDAELPPAAPEPVRPASRATAKKAAAPAKKAAAKKAAAKKTQSRGARVRTIAEIEQSKNK